MTDSSPTPPAWITLALVKRTIAVWQPHYHDQELTAEDAVAMILAVSHLLRPA